MAEAVCYICSECGKTLEAWSDGNPYYIDEKGQKQYAYHPDHENLARCIGNDSPHLCLNCGKEFLVDSRAPSMECPQCGEKDFVSTFELDGITCPFCKRGIFERDSNFRVVS
jgi:DNA-directed RNA polymerase subunit RPC12/RpoP